MEKRHHRTEGEGKFKAQRDVEENAENSQSERVNGPLGKFHSDLCPDRVLADDRDPTVRKCFGELGDNGCRRALGAAEGEQVFEARVFRLDHDLRIVDCLACFGDGDRLR